MESQVRDSLWYNKQLMYEKELIALSKSGARYLVIGAVALGLPGVFLASAKDLLELKKAAGRDKDNQDIRVLERMLEENQQ